MDIGALSLNKSRLPGQRSVTFCPEHEYFILCLPLTVQAATWISDPVIERSSSSVSLFINCSHEGF